MSLSLSNNQKYKYAAIYGFANITDPEKYKKSLLRMCSDNKVLGTILLAEEGINGTISGISKNIYNIIDYIKGWKEIINLEVKFSNSSEHGFYRMKVKVKPEIVSMGKPSINPLENSGEYVSPEKWNDLITRNDVIVIDTRNEYETGIGSFPKSLDPKTKTFRDFPKWADKLNEKFDKSKKIAMYCTGGILCEKASAYMKKIGFEEVYHLKGGILKYLEDVPKEKSIWNGDCFVFDQRVSVLHGLEKGKYKQCYACKMPISELDCENEKYLEGVSCSNCFNFLSEEQKKRFKQRQMQINLSKTRGEKHIGQETPSYNNSQSKKVLY